MLNEKHNSFNLIRLTDILIDSKKTIFIVFIILFISIIIFNSIIFILGMLVGIIITLSIELVVLYFFLGLRSSNFVNQEIIKIPEDNKFESDIPCEDVCDVAEEENKNDLKILYRSVVEKSNFHEANNLANLYIDHNYYCVCKFSPENFINILKLRTEVGSNFSNNILNFIHYSNNLIKVISIILKKCCSLEKFKETEFIDNDINLYHNKYKAIKEIYKIVLDKINQISEIINNVMIISIKSTFTQTQIESKEIENSLNEYNKEIQSKEIELQNLTEKYINQKKLLDNLYLTHKNSKQKEKYEYIVKLEMEIKIATKSLNELKSILSSVADDFREIRNVFTKKCLIAYINTVKIIEREYETIRAIIISLLELFSESMSINIGIGSNEVNHNRLELTNIFDEVRINILQMQFNPELLQFIPQSFSIANDKIKKVYNENFNKVQRLMNILINFKTLSENLSKIINDYSREKNNIIINIDSDFNKLLNSFYKTLREDCSKYINYIEDTSKETNSNIMKVNNIYMILKENNNLINKKIENAILQFNNDLKIISKEKNEISRLELFSRLHENIKNDYENIISLIKSYEMLYHECISILFSNINKYYKLIDLRDNEILAELNNINNKIMSYFTNAVFIKGNEDFKTLIYKNSNIDDNFKKFNEAINSEIIDFLSFLEIKINIIHDSKCIMFQESKGNSLLNESGFKDNYFQKIKDFIIRKLNKNSKKDQNLFQNIEIIMSENNCPDEKEFENHIITNNMYIKKEESLWFNKLLNTWFNRWKNSEVFLKWFKKFLFRIYNKKRPEMLDTIYIDDVRLSGSMPIFKNFKEIQFEKKTDYEFLYDVEISYRGHLQVFLSTDLLVKIPYFKKIINIPLICEFVVNSLSGTIRLYYNGLIGGESWYSFLGQPALDFDINITIGDENRVDINITTIKKYLKEMFIKRFRKYCLPNKRSLNIPLTKDMSKLPENVNNPRLRKNN